MIMSSTRIRLHIEPRGSLVYGRHRIYLTPRMGYEAGESQHYPLINRILRDEDVRGLLDDCKFALMYYAYRSLEEFDGYNTAVASIRKDETEFPSISLKIDKLERVHYFRFVMEHGFIPLDILLEDLSLMPATVIEAFGALMDPDNPPSLDYITVEIGDRSGISMSTSAKIGVVLGPRRTVVVDEVQDISTDDEGDSCTLLDPYMSYGSIHDIYAHPAYE